MTIPLRGLGPEGDRGGVGVPRSQPVGRGERETRPPGDLPGCWRRVWVGAGDSASGASVETGLDPQKETQLSLARTPPGTVRWGLPLIRDSVSASSYGVHQGDHKFC